MNWVFRSFLHLASSLNSRTVWYMFTKVYKRFQTTSTTSTAPYSSKLTKSKRSMCYIAADVVAAILQSKLNSILQHSLIVENSHTQTEVEFIFLHGSFLTTREVPNNTRRVHFLYCLYSGKSLYSFLFGVGE